GQAGSGHRARPCPRAGAPPRRHHVGCLGTGQRQHLYHHPSHQLERKQSERRLMTLPVTIVMIEDDEGHARLIERNIRRSGVNNEIKPFTDGTSAVNYLFGKDGSGVDLKGQALLVLLDLNLPDMSGIEILRQIKENKYLKSTPVVVLTTTDDSH